MVIKPGMRAVSWFIISLFLLSGCALAVPKPETDPNISPLLTKNEQVGNVLAASSDIPITPNQTQINLLAGTSFYVWSVNLNSDVPQAFVLSGHSGEHWFINHTGDFRLQLYDSTAHSIAGPHSQPGPWGVLLPSDGSYVLAVEGIGIGDISIYIPYKVDSWQPGKAAAPTPDTSQRVAFNPETNATTASASMNQGVQQGVVFHAQAGQQLTVDSKGIATITLLDNYGNNISPTSPQSGEWVYSLPNTDTYTIVLMGDGLVQLSMSLINKK